jgi:hypothetical protein
VWGVNEEASEVRRILLVLVVMGGVVLLLADLSTTHVSGGSAQSTADPSSVLEPPTGFDWKPPMRIWKDRYGVFKTDLNIESFAPHGAGKAYYVDPVTGNDHKSGTSRATALRSINTALLKSDIDILYLVPGLYLRDRTWAAAPMRDLSVYVLDGGTAILSRAVNDLEWSVYSGNTYKATRDNVISVWDAKIRDAHGDYSKLAQKSSIADVVTNPASWTENRGALYVHLIDGRRPDSDFDLRVFLKDPPAGIFHADKVLYMENLEFEGGYNHCFHAMNRSESGVSKVYAKNCSFKYSGGGNGFFAQGVTVAILKDCVAALNANDGFNYEMRNSVDPKVTEVNCVGRHNGLVETENNNGSSAHDDTRIVRINGAYYDNIGPNVADVSSARSWNLGCSAYASHAPSSRYNYNFGTSTNARMWLDGCYSRGSTHDFVEAGSSRIRVRETTSGQVIPQGDIESY